MIGKTDQGGDEQENPGMAESPADGSAPQFDENGDPVPDMPIDLPEGREWHDDPKRPISDSKGTWVSRDGDVSIHPDFDHTADVYGHIDVNISPRSGSDGYQHFPGTPGGRSTSFTISSLVGGGSAS